MADLIVKAGMQDALGDYPISSDFYEVLDEEVAELIEEASRRAEANERKTVMPQDL
jgi:histone H3/H4